MPIAKSEAELNALYEQEIRITDAEKKKFKLDKRGRLKVPEDYEPPSGFSGTIVLEKSGVQLDYPGYKIIKRFGQKKTIAR